MDLKTYIRNCNEKVKAELENYMSFDAGPFSLLSDSMSYSLFAGGKMVRPALCLASCEVTNGKEEVAMPFACALEMIHTYSLIHDDLPSMDDDDLRRGKATNHKVYGEAQALLAGNSLLTYAIEICLNAAKEGTVPYESAVFALADMTRSIGIMGVMGGQSLDIMWEGKQLAQEDIETVCFHKTAMLITASVRAGAIVSNALPEKLKAITNYGHAIGLAFQVADDILNVTGTAEKLGKATGSDKERGKTTYPALLGLDGAKKLGIELKDRALSALDAFGEEAWMLRDLARYIVERDH